MESKNTTHNKLFSRILGSYTGENKPSSSRRDRLRGQNITCLTMTCVSQLPIRKGRGSNKREHGAHKRVVRTPFRTAVLVIFIHFASAPLQPASNGVPAESSASTIPMRTNGCRARRNGCKFCSCSVERMVMKCLWSSDFVVFLFDIVENSEPDAKRARCRCESITKIIRVRFTSDTKSLRFCVQSQLNFRERGISTPVDKHIVNWEL